MLDGIKNFLGISEEQKETRKKELEEFKNELDKQVASHKEMLDRNLEKQKTITKMAYDNNSKIEYEKIIDEFEQEFEFLYNDTIENMNTLPLYYSSYFQSFKNMCNSYKTRMEIYGEIPDSINSQIEEKIKLLESMKEEFTEKYKKEKIERIKSISPKAAEVLEKRDNI